MADSALAAAPRPLHLDRALAQPAPAAVLSVAVELPATRLTNERLAGRLGVSEDWILSRTGIRARRQARSDERLADYAAAAGTRALARAGVGADEIDLILVATMTQDEVTPNTAPLVAHALGAGHAGAIDVGAACTGFLSGLALAAAQIESGRAEHILLVGADFLTRLTDYDDKRTAPLFADGAGAVVLGRARSDRGTIGPIVLAADGSRADAIVATHARRTIEMDGPEVFRHAVARMAEATIAVLERAGLTTEDVDLFVYHQANARITRALGERLGIETERVVDCIEMLGNASAATLPVALASAEQDGRLRAGSRVLMSAFGAGFTWGAAVLEWDGGADG